MLASSKVAPPTVSLPKGGGAITSIGETFRANAFTGTASMAIPIPTPSGRGFAPELSLDYSSGSGNGICGIGFQLEIPSISRKTALAFPRYDDSDTFLFTQSDELVPQLAEHNGEWTPEIWYRVSAEGGPDSFTQTPPHAAVFFIVTRYRPRTEGLFERIERWVRNSDGDTHWRTITRDNVTSLYGATDATRIVDPEHPGHIFRWLIEHTYDAEGHQIVYEYLTDQSNKHLSRIKYGNAQPNADPASNDWHFEVDLVYSRPTTAPTLENNTATDPDRPRPDPFPAYKSGFELRTSVRCVQISAFHRFAELAGENRVLVSSTQFAYAATAPLSLLTAVTHTGYNGSVTKELPPLEFSWSPFPLDARAAPETPDFKPLQLEGGRSIVDFVERGSYQLVDLYGEGLPGILYSDPELVLYARPLGDGSYAPPAAPQLFPIDRDVQGGDAALVSLLGDGKLDLVITTPSRSGYYAPRPDGGWEAFASFAAAPTDLRDPQRQLVDVTGDGLADLLFVEQDVVRFYPSQGPLGYGRPQQQQGQGPLPITRQLDAREVIRFGDPFGDGVSHLMRVRNGSVECWPNLGYGRFGPKVEIANPPRFSQELDASRLFFADIDGSGTSDLIYVYPDHVAIYLNRSGNYFSDPLTITLPATWNELGQITLADVLGNGTSCLVLTSLNPDRSLNQQYCDFTDGVKPYMLVGVDNNLGATTRLTYSPSTRFYLADDQAGTPWLTRLPFPVQVVAQVETIDHIGGTRLVASYTYHHGYFDPIDREFRGFGRVEQLDAESFENAPLVASPYAVPPVLTKTWYHTGAYAEAGALLQQYRAEYYQGDAQAHPLPDSTLDPAFQQAPENFSEGYRALHGTILRQEVYALDQVQQPQLSKNPYTVSESNFSVRLVQPKAGQPYAVCFVHPSEELTWHYERNPADPRISHDLTLEVDAYGNLRQSLAIGYGRRAPSTDPLLTKDDHDKQSQLLITYTAASFTNPIDDPIVYPHDYHAPLPAETQTFELTGFKPEGADERFSLDEWTQDTFARLSSAAVIPYEQTASGAAPQKRLFEHLCTRYRPDDMGAAQNDPLALLPLGTLEPLALPGESYTLAFTPGLREQVYVRNGQPLLTTDIAALAGGSAGGGYVDYARDGSWWLPSGREFYSPTASDSPQTELAYARAHFFLPLRYRDPFFATDWDTEHVVTYDAYDLLIVATRDPLGNMVTAVNDYRVLQPALVSDPNGNRTAVAFDALGMVVGTAVMGKPAPAPVEGDSLEGFMADLDESVILDHLANPLADPYAILGNATTRLVYDLFAYQRTRDQPIPQPAVVYAMARETHVAELAAGQPTRVLHSFDYSDGFGRTVQHKAQAEPGPVPLHDANGAIVIGANGQPNMTPNAVSPRWVGSGWTIYNNKGRPVRQFEPFFSDTQRFEFAVTIGVSTILFYDPLGRVLASLHPDQSWTKVVFDAWRQASWDMNDTVLLNPRADADVGDFFASLPAADYLPTWYALRTDADYAAAFALRYPDPTDRANEAQAAKKAALHANTPTVAHFDVLGRAFLTVADNGGEQYYSTRVALDIEGKQRELIDAMGRIALRTEYDMLRSPIHTASIDAVERWLLDDVAGEPLYHWNSRGFQFRTAYDQLRRPTDFFLGSGSAEQLLEHSVYGEAEANPQAANLRGRLFRHFDQAGQITNAAYDFKGNPLQSQRQLAQKYQQTLDWSLQLQPLLEAEAYAGRTRYDALNRPIQLIAPHSIGAAVNVIQPRYNEASLLAQVDAWLNQSAEPGGLLDPAGATMHAVTGIDYNAKGQRSAISYGNGVGTTYTYDPETFALVQLTSTRRSDSAALQGLSYAYDPVGNITHIGDTAQQTIYFRNRRVEPSNDYSYDPLYRLITASGREHLAQAGAAPTPYSATDAPRVGLPQPGDGEAMAAYSEQYVYDAVGNILTMQHRLASGQGWTRSYTYAEASPLEAGKQSNRLSSTAIGTTVETYSANGDGYDPHGNMLHMPHLSLMRWDERDQLQATAQQVVTNGGTPETTWYVYSGGQRVRQVTERQAAAGQAPTRKAERIYLGGFEIYREYAGDGASVSLERETLHIMDDAQTVALVETRTKGSDPGPQQLARYQLGNQLGSAVLELDGQAQIISYEEYSPYGSTTYQAVRSQTEAPKRYRYSGKERDEANRCYYYGARYYAPWLARWTSPDPAGMVDGPNLYAFVRGNPINHVDIGGLGGEKRTREETRKSAEEIQEGLEARLEELGFEKVKSTHQGKGIYASKETIPSSVDTNMTEERLIVRHLSTFLLNQFPDKRTEVQAAISHKKKTIYVAANADETRLGEFLAEFKTLEDLEIGSPEIKLKYVKRAERHIEKLKAEQEEGNYAAYKIELVRGLAEQHAETKLLHHFLRKNIAFNYVGGTRRPCVDCTLEFLAAGINQKKFNPHSGPFWSTISAGMGLNNFSIKKWAKGYVGQGTKGKLKKRLITYENTKHDSDSE